MNKPIWIRFPMAELVVIVLAAAGDMSIAERCQLWVQDMTRGYNAIVLLSLVGFLLIGPSVLIDSSLD